MKICSSNKLNVVFIFMLHLAFTHSRGLPAATGRLVAEVSCYTDNHIDRQRCPIQNATPEMNLRVSVKEKPECKIQYGLSDDNSYIWMQLPPAYVGICGGLFEIRDVGKESGRPAHPLTCGRRGGNDEGYRIVGGSGSQKCEFPWMVYVQVGENMCGGSILDRSHILTAAHCVAVKSDEHWRPISPQKVFIVSGTSYINGWSKQRSVSEIVIHPHYEHFLYPVEVLMLKLMQLHVDNDIAIMKLEQPLDWDSCHSPICLPDGKTAPENGGDCIVAGWGRTSNFHKRPSHHLLWADTDVGSCRGLFNTTTNGFCASGNNAGTCDGDSGGPLACRRSDSEGYIQYGITSGGIENKCGTLPSNFADVNKFLPWINGVLGK